MAEVLFVDADVETGCWNSFQHDLASWTRVEGSRASRRSREGRPCLAISMADRKWGGGVSPSAEQRCR